MRIPIFALAGITSLILAACGGNGGGTNNSVTPVTPPLPSALTLASITPANGATVGIEAIPVLSFDAAPDMASVTASSVTLSSAIGNLEARLTLNGNNVVITPVKPLAWGSHYQLRVSDAVRGAAGGKLSAASIISFDTRMPKWTAATTITAAGVNVAGIGSAGSANGDTIAIWSQSGSDLINRLMVSRYAASTQRWSVPVQVSNSQSYPQAANIAMNDSGAACVIWEEKTSGDAATIKAVRYDPASGWGTASTISKIGGYKSEYGRPQVAIARNGNIIVAWKQYANAQSFNSTTDVAYYDASSQQWLPARSLQSIAGTTEFVQTAIAANGDAMVLWPGISGIYGVMNVSRYDAAAKSWGTTSIAGSEGSVVPGTFYMGIDQSSNAVAIWKESANGRVITAHYDAAAKAWSNAEPLLPFGSGLRGASMDSAGNVMLTALNGFYNVESARYDHTANKWTVLPSLPDTGSYDMSVSMDLAGNAFIAWNTFSNGIFTMKSRRYNVTSGTWEAPQVIAQNDTGISNPVISMDQSGQAVLLWQQKTTVINASSIAYSSLRGL